MPSAVETATVAFPRAVPRKIDRPPRFELPRFQPNLEGLMFKRQADDRFVLSHGGDLWFVRGCNISDNVHEVLGKVVRRCINGEEAGPNEFIGEGIGGRMIVQNVAPAVALQVKTEINAKSW